MPRPRAPCCSCDQVLVRTLLCMRPGAHALVPCCAYATKYAHDLLHDQMHMHDHICVRVHCCACNQCTHALVHVHPAHPRRAPRRVLPAHPRCAPRRVLPDGSTKLVLPATHASLKFWRSALSDRSRESVLPVTHVPPKFGRIMLPDSSTERVEILENHASRR